MNRETAVASETSGMQFRDTVALVTGAGSGIGKATAVLLAKEGSFVGLLGRSEDELIETLDEIRSGGGDGMVLKADISDMEDMRIATDQLFRVHGRLDIVVANAGVNGVWAR